MTARMELVLGYSFGNRASGRGVDEMLCDIAGNPGPAIREQYRTFPLHDQIGPSPAAWVATPYSSVRTFFSPTNSVLLVPSVIIGILTRGTHFFRTTEPPGLSSPFGSGSVTSATRNTPVAPDVAVSPDDAPT